MKLGIVTPGGFDRSGTERVIPVFLWLVERLARRHEVHVFTLYQYPTPETFPLLGATVHNIGDRNGKRRLRTIISRTLAEIGREHARGKFDVMHGLWATTSGLAAVLAGRRWGIPSVVTVAGGEIVALPEIGYGGCLSRGGRLKVGLTLRLANAVTSAAEFTRKPLMKRRPDARLIVLGADTSRFEPPPTADPSQGHGPPWRLLHVASLNRVKDQPTLLRAFREIHDAEPQAHLDIVGEDTLNGETQALATSLGLDDAVTFHGFQTSDAVARMLQDAYLLLHTSVFEDAGPLTFLEAAACGVPTVGTSVGIIDDLAGQCTVAVPVGDHAALARETVKLLRDTAVRDALGRRALEFARSHDADWTACEFEKLYGEMVKR